MSADVRASEHTAPLGCAAHLKDFPCIYWIPLAFIPCAALRLQYNRGSLVCLKHEVAQVIREFADQQMPDIGGLALVA